MTSPTTDEHNPLVSITEFADDGKLQIIHRYGGGGFSIAKQPYEGSQLVSMRKTTGWAVTHSDDITFESLKPLIETENPPELILFGLGETPMTHLPEIRTQLHALNIKIGCDEYSCGMQNLEYPAYRRKACCRRYSCH